MPLLFELARPLDDLAGMLLKDFSGQTLPMSEVFRRHHIGKPFVKKNYKQVLMDLEKAGKITAKPPLEKRRKGTFAEGTLVSFPKGKGSQ